IDPVVGLCNKLKQRISVDFPLPDRPIITKTSPFLISSDASYTPTVCPVFSKISSFDIPLSMRGMTDFGLGPKIFETPSSLICVVILIPSYVFGTCLQYHS